MLMYKRIVSVILAFIISILVTSCQSTPEDSLVVNKTGDEINSLIEKEATGPVITDGHITETITCCGDRVLANVDAKIKSDFDYYGVYEIERTTITQEHVDKAVELLYGDSKLYNYTNEQMTKEKYDFYIKREEEAIADIKANPKKYEQEIKDSPYADYDSLEEWLASREKRLKELKNERKTAPTEAELKERVNTKLHYSTEDEYGIQFPKDVKVIMLSTDMGNEYDASFIVEAPDDVNSLKSTVKMQYTNGSEIEGRTTEKTTNQEALELAEQFALAMDENFVLTKNSKADNSYKFVFSIAADGMPISKKRYVSDYARNWLTGQMIILVDDSGINTIQWDEPIKVTKTVNDKVEMISAERAYETFMNYFKLKYASDSIYEYGIEKQIFDIYEVSVSYVIEPVKDDSSVARVMPCWDFICKHTVKVSDGTPDEVAERASIFAINAIDNSIILN